MSDKLKRRRAVYVVCASDSSWPGVLGVHGSRASAAGHHLGIVADRKRWYRELWDWWDRDTDYTREHDPLFAVAMTRLVWDTKKRTVQHDSQPEDVMVKTLRVWL